LPLSTVLHDSLRSYDTGLVNIMKMYITSLLLKVCITH